MSQSFGNLPIPSSRAYYGLVIRKLCPIDDLSTSSLNELDQVKKLRLLAVI